jgi:hypothetical protein
LGWLLVKEVNQATDEWNWDQIRTENETQMNFGDSWIDQQAPDTWGAPDVSPNDETMDDILWRQETVRHWEDLRRETQIQVSQQQAECIDSKLNDWAGPRLLNWDL